MARVLVVDDQETDRRLMQALLVRGGHQAEVADGGESALRRYLERGIDVVVTDLHMPDVHGFELISILRDFTPPPPIVAVSATGHVQLHMAAALGATITLAKPLDPMLLLDAVERALSAESGREARSG